LQTYDTIGERLSEANISWAWYSGGWDDAKPATRIISFNSKQTVFKSFSAKAAEVFGEAEDFRC
jgi:Phosphoesterase family